MIDGAGAMRAHWAGLVDALDTLSDEDFAKRAAQARRTLRRNGVTHNVYAGSDHPQGGDRPWPIDILPMLIGPDDWRVIAEGVVQRARLIEALLADLYGPRRLLADGTLHPAILFDNPDYLPAAWGAAPAGGRWLVFYAADLTRGADGGWEVVQDRTQAPSGAGYAMENRQVVARALREAFDATAVRPLWPYFEAMRDGLAALAPSRRLPRIVLLTPGPYNETYFEQAFLARALGILLAEGQDLIVRDLKVHIKTLRGLEPVDVILRRTDDAFCDPLALRPDSLLGVPGLSEAARAGTVAVANMLGTGLAECAMAQAHLDRLAPRLLGEAIKLPTRPARWLGDGAGLEEDALRGHLVAPAFGPPGIGEIDPAILDPDDRAALIARIRAWPEGHVLRRAGGLSSTPSRENGRLVAKPALLRVHALASADGGWTVLPGGLARVGAGDGRADISMQHGGQSKDVWVVSAPEHEGITRTIRQAAPAVPKRIQSMLTSRLADSFFWLGRHCERLESSLRRLRAIMHRLEESMDPGAAPDLRTLGRLMIRFGHLPAGAPPPEAALGQAVRATLADPGRPDGIIQEVERVKRLATVVRDRLSADLWRQIMGLAASFEEATPDDLALIDRLMGAIVGFAGLEDESMRRGLGWRFLDMGRRIERAATAAGVLDTVARVPEDEATEALEIALELSDSDLPYRTRYFTAPRLALVADMLIADASNPRSLQFQISRLREHLEVLPPARGFEGRARLRGLKDALRAVETGPDTAPETVATLCAHCIDALGLLSDDLTAAYFQHRRMRRAMPFLRRLSDSES